jgi:RimJ/RimL family protein N-acetyltransferase
MERLSVEIPARIDTGRLLLRQPQPGDGWALCEAVSASIDELRLWMPWAQDETTTEASEANVGRMQANFERREDLVYFIFERGPDGGEGALVGGTGLHRIEWTVPRFEIGYWRRTDRAGRGFVTEAVRALSRMAFDALAAQRVEIRMDNRNLASARVAERAGFRCEGLLRRDTRGVSGEVRDTLVYSRVRGVEEP